MKKFTLILLFVSTLIVGNVRAQCVPQSTYGDNAWQEAAAPGVVYQGYLCQGHDSIYTRNGWAYYDGDGYIVHLIAGSQVEFTTQNCATSAASLTLVDSTGATGGVGVVIPGAFAAATCPNSLIVTAPYTGKYYIVFDTDNDCSTTGADSVGTATAKLLNPGAITNCSPFAAPANDTICGAITITEGVMVAGNTAFAAGSDPLDAAAVTAGYACGTPNNTLWYSFTAPVTELYYFDTNSPAGGLDGYIGVFEASACTSPLTYVSCIFSAFPNGSYRDSLDLTAGTTYFIMMDGYSGSVGAFDLIIQRASTVGIHENTAQENLFMVYPNPAKDQLTITPANALKNYSLKITNAMGATIFTVDKTSQPDQVIDISHYANGIYTVQLETESGVSVKKVVKQ